MLDWQSAQTPLAVHSLAGIQGSPDVSVSTAQAFLSRYSALLENGGKDPSTPAGREVQERVLVRRQEEARVALFSDWSSALYAWNKEETGVGLTPPSTTFWKQVLVRAQPSCKTLCPCDARSSMHCTCLYLNLG